eukprot:TRINITY_DN282_c0_g1_i12.p1 TRINITY_DN282_c0_g1~~TRINITY_DN282_c0_g1_i12.p1  ORF type:complete len:177 (-),score=30.20 TRINITY_DN282_c0_g1_i12:42-572(-)
MSDSDAEDTYEVEGIIAHKIEAGVVMYYIKWKGYSDSENTWQTRDDLHGSGALLTDYHRRYPEIDPESQASNIDLLISANYDETKDISSQSFVGFSSQNKRITISLADGWCVEEILGASRTVSGLLVLWVSWISSSGGRAKGFIPSKVMHTLDPIMLIHCYERHMHTQGSLIASHS